MEPIVVGRRTIPVAAPDRLDIVSLLEAFLGAQRKPAALNRLKLAAIGLAWWAAYDLMPDRTPTDKAERVGVKPPFPRLDDCDCDLLQLGKKVGAALGDDAIEARGAGDVLAADLFRLVIPSDVERETARGNSEGRRDSTGAPYSDSAASITATPSPVSG